MRKLTFLFALLCVSVMGWAVDYCETEIGHFANANADPNSFVLLSISSDGAGHTTVKIQQDQNKNSQMFDYLQVSGYKTTGSDVVEGGYDNMEVTFDTPTPDANGDITLEILWSTINWTGRWMVQNLKASATATCNGGGSTPEPSASPQEAAPTPDVDAENVFAIYSDAYTVSPTWGYNEAWSQTTACTPSVISENNYLWYTNFNYLGWQVSNNNIDVSTYEYLHIDIWAYENGSISIYPIQGVVGSAAENDSKKKTLNLAGQQWNSYDLDLGDSDFSGLDFSKIYQFKFADGSNCSKFAVDNVYFYKEGSGSTPDPTPTSIDWSEVSFVEGSSQYKVGALSSSDLPNVVNIQKPGWAEETGIYMTFPSADQLACSLGAAISGAGMVVYLSNFLGAEETEVTVTWKGGSKTFYVYNNAPMTLPATKAATPAVAASRVRAIYSQYALNAGMTMMSWSNGMTKTDVLVEGRSFPSFKFGNYLGLGYGTINVANMDNIHLDIWTENSFTINFYIVGNVENSYNISLTGGQWNNIDIPLSNFTADKAAIKEFKFAEASLASQTIFIDNIYFYANADLPDPTPSEIEDTNFASRTNGAIAYASSINGENFPAKAIDGSNDTQWESAWDTDPQSLVVDFGQRRIFNNVKIYWGNQWSSEFYLETSNNGVDWTEVKHVTNNTTDVNNSQQNFELDAQATARYIRFRGIHRANGYGYTIKELDAFLAGTPVLNVVTLSSDKTITKVGEYATLTAEPKDQNSSAIAAELSYSVMPVDAGHVTDGKYYPDKAVAATITVTAEAGEVSVNNDVQIYGVSSDNIALNKTSEAGYNPGNQAEINTKVNDGAENTAWVTWDWRDASEEWWYVDLGSLYDITGISVLWGADYSTNYILQVRDDAPSAEDKADDGAWTTVATVTTASANNVAFNYVTATGRYVRLHSLAKPGPCIRLRELQIFGSESATLTKAVSASVNDDAMGTATVKQSGEAVTEVDTNSEVEFSAVAKDGYIFVSWSNGETRPTFTTTVSETMNLTATFRAMGTVYCNTLVHSSNGGQEHDAYVTMKRTAANTYQLIVRAEYELGNFSNTEFRIKEEGAANTSNFNLNNKGVLSDGNHTLTGTIISTVEPEMISGKLYVNIVGQWEGQFDRLTNIEYAVACDDNVSVTSIELSQSSAKLLVSKTLTLTPMFAPVYATDKALTWETSNSSVATVVDGVVTAQAAGTATITAKLTSDNSIYATCTVTVVESLTEATWYGYEFVAPQEGQTVFTYAITRSVDQKLTFTMTTDKNVIGFVAFININGTDYQLNGYGAGLTASYTTTDTYEDNVLLNCMWDFRSANYRQTFDFTYRVGDENDALKILTIDDDVDNTTIIEPFDGQNVNLSIVNRSFVADNLYTLVLPFNADAAQTAAKLPGKLTKLNNTYVKENKDLRVNFVDAEAIEAGVPYLYSPSADVTNAIFENVTVSKDLQPTEPADGLAKYYGIYAPTTGSALKTIPNAYVLGSDQYLYDVQTLSNEQSMKALRGYFVLNFPPQSLGMRARVVFNSQETEVATGISDVQSDVQCTKVIRDGQLLILRDGKTYNVQGQLIK